MTSCSRLVEKRAPASAVVTFALAAACTVLAACGKPSAGTTRLAALPLDPASVTVSGVSAGASMATQFHVAHSSLVNGAALVAGAPYYCSAGSIRNSLGRCMKADEPIPTSELVELTSRLALEGSIDPITGLANDRVWIFRGGLDPYVQKPVADAVEVYYQSLVNPANIARVELDRAGHTFPSARADAKPCDVTEPPFVGKCDFDGAGTLLGHLYGKLNAGRAPGKGELREFDQRPYSKASGSAGLADRGLLFVPASCSSGGKSKCRLHVVFHGCKQGASLVGREFVLGSGYLEAAAANDIVLLFPQIEPSYRPLNPMGCWDWWGYEGENYAVKDGPQIKAVRLMIGDLLGEPRG
jgi:poly(3-hydroxybutyrate) depolymerase